ncbi:uncharacterized protein tdrd12 [Centroberyx gerrardi]
MLKISILKVENPSCLWGRVVQRPGGDAESPEQYEELQVRMNLFYHDVSQDVRRLKPPALQEGQVCVVYWCVLRSWCRAVVESVFLDSVSCQARCLLVDHGERLIVPSDQIRVAVQNFLQLPFCVRRFCLAGIKPTTLRVSVCEEKAELIPSGQWDSSATLHLHNLLQASTQTEAVLHEAEAETTCIELYLTVRSVKICVNDDLVAKKFAYYSRESVQSGGLEEAERRPAMLTSDPFSQTDAFLPFLPFLTSHTPTAHTHSAPDRLTAAGPADLLSSTALLQKIPQTCEAVSDGSGDTDSSLAAALTKNLSLFRFLKFLNPFCGRQQAVSRTDQNGHLNNGRPGETPVATNTCPGPDRYTANTCPGPARYTANTCPGPANPCPGPANPCPGPDRYTTDTCPGPANTCPGPANPCPGLDRYTTDTCPGPANTCPGPANPCPGPDRYTTDTCPGPANTCPGPANTCPGPDRYTANTCPGPANTCPGPANTCPGPANPCPGPDRYTTNTCPGPDRYTANTCPGPDRYTANPFPGPDRYTANTCPGPDRYTANTCPGPDRYTGNTCPGPDRYTANPFPGPDRYTTNTCPGPDRYTGNTCPGPDRYTANTCPGPANPCPGPDRYTANPCPGPANPCPGPDRYTANPCPGPDRYTANPCPGPDRYTANTCPGPDRYTANTCPGPDRYTANTCPGPDRYTANTCPSPDRYTAYTCPGPANPCPSPDSHCSCKAFTHQRDCNTGRASIAQYEVLSVYIERTTCDKGPVLDLNPGRPASVTQADLSFSSGHSRAEDPFPSDQAEPQAEPQAEGTSTPSTITSSPSTITSSPSRAAETGSRLSSEEDLACSRLLEWLNPEPLTSDPDSADDSVCPSDPSRSLVLVRSALPLEPCSSLERAPVTSGLCRVLRRRRYGALSLADRYSWPAVARGCDTLLVSHAADQPLSYLPPLLTHIQLNSVFSLLTSSTGPIAVLVCPGWEKAQAVSDLLEESQVTAMLRPLTVLLGVAKDEAKAVRIPKNCLLLVTTPFSLVRLLACHCFLFLRLYHLVLDEADQLFSLAPDQMATILQHFRKVTSSEEKTSCPRQLVAVAKRWTNHMEGLLANHMSCPCVVMTVAEEAALYGNVQQVILLALESSKVSVLLGALDFSPDVGQKTLVVANSAEEVEDVFKAVSNTSAFCLKTHEGLTHQFDFVTQQWKKDIGPGTQVILVTTNECLVAMGIRDATCVVHYGFPSSPRLFGSRLFCMADNFRNPSDPDPPDGCPRPARSVLLISERNARHVVGVLRYLRRTDAPLPPELLSFAEGVHLAREDQKTGRPLCSQLKSFGVCRDSSVCPDRHRFRSHLDRSVLPAAGVIEVLPLYIKSASVFCGRIVRKEDGGFDSLVSEMASCYAEKKPGAEEVEEGNLYAVQEDQTFHRVKVLSVPDRGERLFFSVLVQFVDEGREEEVKSHQLLQLPARFQTLPPQAVEIIVCRVKPADAEPSWNPKVTRTISQKIRGLQHRARAVLSLGNTVFVDPMVRVSQLPGMKTLINEYDVVTEILNSGMGAANPQHLDLLRALCEGGGATSPQEANHIAGSEDSSAALELRLQAVEEALAEAFRAAEGRKLSAPEPNWFPVPVPPEPELHRVPVCDQEPRSDVQVRTGRSSEHTAGLQADGQTISLHPQVCWYQRSDCVMVTVKLISPESQSCRFYPERAVYSGRVTGRRYRADLQLHAAIAAERCCWEMKSNQPVLRLVKQQQGHWDRLLRDKSIFVSYDLEHFEEEEDRTLNGVRFVENTGEDSCYVDSDSGSESD